MWKGVAAGPVPALIVILMMGSLGCEGASEDSIPRNSRPNIILISIDTLRADHLGAYGYDRDTSPTIDALARDGVLFEYANATMPKTSPSLFSLLTGLYPKTHRVNALGLRISDSIELLPEVLKRRGYRTGGVVGQWNCHRKFGFDRGFDFYDDDFDFEQATLDRELVKERREREGARFLPASERRAQTIVDRSIAWLERIDETDGAQDSSPFFLWMHLMDPHAAYDPPLEFAPRFEGEAPRSGDSWYGSVLRKDQIHVQAYIPGVTSLDDYVNRYDDEIAYLDHHLEVFFEYLEKKNLYRDALIILTADHGEYMGENMRVEKFFNHGATSFESEVRVPLILKFPGNGFRGKRVSTPASLVDVFPSIMEIIGETDSPSEGKSILGQIDGLDLRPDATSFIQVGRGLWMAVRRGPYKLAVRSPIVVDELIEKLGADEEVALRIQLFDVVSDPLERKDVSAEHPEIRASLYAAFVDWLVTPSLAEVFSTKDRMDAETAAHLRALGYIEEADSVEQ